MWLRLAMHSGRTKSAACTVPPTAERLGSVFSTSAMGPAAVDLTLDVTNPRIIYASIWQVHRHFWELVSGGPDSGLWKSTDGGDSWTEISRNPGLPQEGTLGKIGISVSPARPSRDLGDRGGGGRKGRVCTAPMIAGATWEHLTNNQDLLNRPWYYLHIFRRPAGP